MLAQLVCVDRRYQRMNCFNIRELQSMLKRRFFTDLVSSNDHRELLNNTMIGLRYKTNSNNLLDADISNFYNFGTTFNPKTRNTNFTNNYTVNNTNFFNSTLSNLYLYISEYFVLAYSIIASSMTYIDNIVFGSVYTIQNLKLTSAVSMGSSLSALLNVLSLNFT